MVNVKKAAPATNKIVLIWEIKRNAERLTRNARSRISFITTAARSRGFKNKGLQEIQNLAFSVKRSAFSLDNR
jgi:hypothetical protein